MSQKVADANDLPPLKVHELSDFLAELDASRPGGEVDLTERQDRFAEVAEFLRPNGEAFPRLAAVLPPSPSRAVMTAVGSCRSLKARLDRGVPLDVGIELGQERVQIIGIPRLGEALDGLHVLLRHRPRSISRESREKLDALGEKLRPRMELHGGGARSATSGATGFGASADERNWWRVTIGLDA
jgi:hypothetical protein